MYVRMSGALYCMYWMLISHVLADSVGNLQYLSRKSQLDRRNIHDSGIIHSHQLLRCSENNHHKCLNTSNILTNIDNPYIGGNIVIIGKNGCTIGSVFQSSDCEHKNSKSCPKVGTTSAHCFVCCITMNQKSI